MPFEVGDYVRALNSSPVSERWRDHLFLIVEKSRYGYKVKAMTGYGIIKDGYEDTIQNGSEHCFISALEPNDIEWWSQDHLQR